MHVTDESESYLTVEFYKKDFEILIEILDEYLKKVPLDLGKGKKDQEWRFAEAQYLRDSMKKFHNTK